MSNSAIRLANRVRLSGMPGNAFDRLMASKAKVNIDRSTIRDIRTLRGVYKPPISNFSFGDLAAEMRWEDIRIKAEFILSQNADDWTAHSFLAGAYHMLGRDREAIAHDLNALSCFPRIENTYKRRMEKAAIFNGLGTAYAANKEHAKAVEAFEKAYELGWDNDRVLFAAARGASWSYLSLKMLDDAEATLRIVSRIYPNDIRTKELRLTYGILEGDWLAAFFLYKHIYPSSSASSVRAGFAEYFWKARNIVKEMDHDSLFEAAHYYTRRGKGDLADAFYEQIEKLNFMDPAVQMECGRYFRNAGEHERAKRCYERALEYSHNGSIRKQAAIMIITCAMDIEDVEFNPQNIAFDPNRDNGQ